MLQALRTAGVPDPIPARFNTMSDGIRVVNALRRPVAHSELPIGGVVVLIRGEKEEVEDDN